MNTFIATFGAFGIRQFFEPLPKSTAYNTALAKKP